MKQITEYAKMSKVQLIEQLVNQYRDKVGTIDSTSGKIHIWMFTTEESLRSYLVYRKFIKPEDVDVIAYCAQYSKSENEHLAGEIFFCKQHSDIDTIAHECTHLSLGLLSRDGEATSMIVTTEEADPIEESLCYSIGEFTKDVYERVMNYHA